MHTWLCKSVVLLDTPLLWLLPLSHRPCTLLSRAVHLSLTSPVLSIAMAELLAVSTAVVSLVLSAHRTTTAVFNSSLVTLGLALASGWLGTLLQHLRWLSLGDMWFSFSLLVL
jgi:hypothetical protein